MNKSPIIKNAIFDKNHDWFRCPYCNEPIEYKEKKCRRCHEEISWGKEIIVYDATGRRCCYHCRSADGIKGISVDDNPEHSLLLCSKCRKELIKKLNESENGNMVSQREEGEKMADLNNTIQTIEHCINGGYCNRCKLREERRCDATISCKTLLTDAVELLKEQEQLKIALSEGQKQVQSLLSSGRELEGTINILKGEIDRLRAKQPIPLKPKTKVRHGRTPRHDFYCPSCMKLFGTHSKYCPDCGQPIDWRT